MVIVKLSGGLGNQMFQYAMGYTVSLNEPVFLDLSVLSGNQQDTDSFTPRTYELGIFKLSKTKKLNIFLAKLIATTNKKYNLLKKFLPYHLRHVTVIKDDDIFTYKKGSRSYYVDGYFQNAKYFELQRDDLLKAFTFPPLPNPYLKLEKLIRSFTNPVSIHVRRGDYLKESNQEVHGLLNLSYYKTAVDRINQTVKDPSFFIFSDDPEWCRANLGFISAKEIISSDGEPWIDMYLMTLCNHHIIANSSFSWWGAWLNKNKDKCVIAPENWFNSKTSDILPHEWTKL